jgi:hypothetical protein
MGIIATAVGCSGHPKQTAAQADLDRAQAALQAALDSWKAGGKPGAIPGRVAEVTDPDWAAGQRLTAYLIYGADGRPDELVKCGAALTVRDTQGNSMTKDVVYSVRGAEPFVIVREP